MARGQSLASPSIAVLHTSRSGSRSFRNWEPLLDTSKPGFLRAPFEVLGRLANLWRKTNVENARLLGAYSPRLRRIAFSRRFAFPRQETNHRIWPGRGDTRSDRHGECRSYGVSPTRSL